MNKTKITPFQWTIITFFLLNSFIPLIGYHVLTKINKTNSLISIIIGSFLITIFIFIIKNIFHHKPSKNILEKIESLFPKSKYLFFITLAIIAIVSLIYSVSNLVTFINYYILKEVSLIVITVTLLLTILYILTKSLDSIFRLSEICFYIYIFIFIITLIGMFKYMNLYSVKPLLSSPIKDTIISSTLYLSSSFIPLFILGMIPLSSLSRKKKFDFHFLRGAILSSIMIFINLFSIITTLGIELTNIYQNPDMILYKKISFLNVLERVETTLAFNNILNSFFFILMAIYFLKEIIKKIFNIKKEKEKIFLSLIILGLTLISSLLIIPLNLYLIASIITLVITIIINIKIIIDKHNHQKLKKS